MKKLHLLKTMLLLCALIVGSSSVWADTATFDFDTNAGTDFGITGTSSSSSTAGDITSNVQATINGVTVTITPSGGGTANRFWNKSPKLRMYGGTMTISAGDNEITAISFTVGSGKFDVTANNGTVSGSSTSYSWSGTASSIVFNINDNTQIKEFTVTYSAPTPKTDPTITFNDGSVRVGKTLNLSTLFTSNSSGAVTYSITSGGSYASLVGNTLTGTATGSVIVKAEQAAEGTYNAGEKSATITVNPALVLSSIAVTKSPTKTTYTEGETFDPTGMVVTATYSDESTDDVTAACSFTPSGALSTSDTEITISYTENDVNTTTTQAITVNEVVDYVTLPFNWEGGGNAGLRAIDGVTTNVDASDYAESHAPYRIKFNGTGKFITFKTNEQPGIVTIGIKKVGGKNNSTIKIEESSDGTKFTEVQSFQTEGNSSNTIFNFQTTNNFNANTIFVRIYFQKDGDNVGVGPITITGTETITLNAACNDGEFIYGTYSSSNAFRVPADLNVSAVSVAGGKLTVTNYETGDIVKANTGVMVSATSAGDKTVALSSETGTEIDGNMLKASSVAMDGDNLFYRLTMHNGTQIGFYYGAAEGAAFDIVANKAYLAVPSGTGARDFFWFDEGETTAISEVRGLKSEVRGEYFNLNGQRVAQPTKGLYIVNGRKVVIK